MLLILTLVLVFVGTAGLMLGAFVFTNRRRLAAQQAMRERLSGSISGGRGEATASILRDERVADLDILNALLSGKNVTQWASTELARAGSTRNPGELLLGCMIAGLVGAWAGFTYGGGALGLAIGTGIGVVLPIGLLKRQQANREKKLEEQLPEALDMLVNALKAGYSLQAAMEFVGNEMAAPLGPEFARFYDEQRLGVDVRAALLRLQDRVGTYDIKMFVTALLIQRETGGNLGEVLGNIATLMRERVAFRGTVDTLTAEPKASARVLSALPVAVFLFIYSSNRDFLAPLLTTSTGHALMAYAVASVIVGYFVLMQIAKIDM